MSDFLLDTHVFLWWQWNDAHLGKVARATIVEPGNRIFVSAASVWEIALKSRRGKLNFGASPAAAITQNGFFERPVMAKEIEAAGELDWTHVDPFDRLLVAQAVTGSLVLITGDAAIRAYPGVIHLPASD